MDREFLAGLARAFAGALIFSLPMLMTMEMWWLGFYLHPLRLAAFVLISLPLLVGLSWFGGFESTGGSLRRSIADALVAIAVATLSSTIVLAAFNVVSGSMTGREIVGKITLQMVPASIGALLARSQLGEKSVDSNEREKAGRSYFGELFVMLVGALFLSLNVAPTEEMILIGYKMTPWHELALVVLSLSVMHALVYSVQFRGTHKRPEGASFLATFARFTVAGYGAVLLASLVLLWLLGRTDDSAPDQILSAVIVLSFPGAIGAAAARLVL